MFKAIYFDTVFNRADRVVTFDSEEALLNDFFSYIHIKSGARRSWVGLTENLLLPEDDYDHSDLVCVDIGNYRYLTIELA